jgi:hypothetical protein
MSLRRSLKNWLEATHGPVFELHRHYTQQLFASDLVTSADDLRRVVVTSLALIASLGLLVPKMYYKKYEVLSLSPNVDLYRRAIYADQLFLIVITMLAIATLVTFRWDSLFPNRQDYLVLRPLPLKLSQIYFAKLTTLSGLVLTVIALFTIPCAFSFATIIAGAHDLAGFWQEAGAQIFACLGAGAFVLFALALLQIALMNVLPLRWYARASASLQSLLLVAILCVIPWTVDLPNAVHVIDLRPAWGSFAPPLWFLCLYEQTIGHASAYDRALAVRGILATCIALLATVLVSALMHQRYAKRVFESEGKVGHARLRVLEYLAEKLAANVRESAILIFALRSLDRMKQHRIIRLMYAGVGCALVLESGSGVLLTGAMNHGRVRHGAALDAVFALPLVLFFFLFTGLRYAFRLPVDLRANWVFRLTAPDAVAERERAVRTMYIGFGLLPAIAGTAPFLCVVVIPWKAAYGIVFAILIGLLIIESEVENSDNIPLTCSYLPGKRNILHTGIIYWLTVFMLTTFLAGLEGMSAVNPIRAGLVLLMLTLMYWRKHQRESASVAGIRFDDLPEPAVLTLGLSRE